MAYIIDKMALERAKEIAKYISGSVLDVGANTRLLKKFVSDYTSIDLNGFHDVLASAENLPFKNDTFNSVVLSEVIEHLKNPSHAVKECARVAKTRVIITTPNPFRLDYLLEWGLRKKDIASRFHICRFGENEMNAIVNGCMELSGIEYVFLEIPTFSRYGSISINLKNRFGSCSIYVYIKSKSNAC